MADFLTKESAGQLGSRLLGRNWQFPSDWNWNETWLPGDLEKRVKGSQEYIGRQSGGGGGFESPSFHMPGMSSGMSELEKKLTEMALKRLETPYFGETDLGKGLLAKAQERLTMEPTGLSPENKAMLYERAVDPVWEELAKYKQGIRDIYSTTGPREEALRKAEEAGFKERTSITRDIELEDALRKEDQSRWNMEYASQIQNMAVQDYHQGIGQGMSHFQAMSNALESARNRAQQTQMQQMQQRWASREAGLGRDMEMKMYQMKQAQADRESRRTSKSSMFGSIGSLLGTGLGFALGGPWGAAIGGGIGGGASSGLSSMSRYTGQGSSFREGY